MTLKELRAQTGMTQAQVGKELDVDQSAVAHWESGKWKPCRKYQKKLARLYGCTVDDLLAGTESSQNA